MKKLILFLSIVFISFSFISNKDFESTGLINYNYKNKIKKIIEEQDIEYAYPHFSSDGNRILFQSNKSGKWQLYVMTDDVNSMYALTSGKSNNNFPDWSPDDKRVCFVSDRTGNEEIFVMDITGKNIIQLSDNKARDIHPYWSPDGKLIYFNSTRGNGSFDIYSIDPLTKELNRITDTKDDETCARKSPKSNELVFLRNNDKGLDDVFLMDLSTKSETNITNTPTTDGWPCWSSDGKKILYSAINSGGYCLYQYNLKKKTTKQLTKPNSPAEDCRPNISKNNRKIVFNRQVEGPKNTIGIYTLEL